jgi:hypothetical protein
MMKQFNRLLAVWIGLLMLTPLAGGAEAPSWDTFADTWVASDGLGRAMPTFADTGGVKKDRAVGIFYFLWLGQHGRTVYDNTRLLAEHPDGPAYGPAGQFHFWGEPLFGYYQADEEFVVRKHAQMLADAGVDVMIFDVTNAVTYPKVYLTVCKVMSEMRVAGMKTPGIAFLANSNSPKVVQTLYDDFYSKKLYPELWFMWKGRPLLLAPDKDLKPEVKAFFTLRQSWAWSQRRGWFGDGRDKWTWVDNYPQKAGWHDSPNKPEEISVATAQHPVSNIGRSFHDGREPAADAVAPEKGLCFAEQWKRALEVDSEFVFITGWNEWIAQRFISKDGNQTFLGKRVGKGGTFFVDQYNQEFSRDIEPMKGGHGDNYYYQMIANIRRYKGTRELPPVSRRAIVVDGKFDDWKEAGPEFRDTIGDPVHRDSEGYDKGTRYKNETGRNDLIAAKVSYDDENVYFYVRTKEAISPASDPNWMMLFIDADHDAKTGWLGYDFAVNRSGVGANKTTLERHTGGAGYQWEKAAEVQYRVAGNEMEMAIPRSALGIKKLPATVDFKWADNIQQTGEASDFTVNGDVAPNDRFNFRAVMK